MTQLYHARHHGCRIGEFLWRGHRLIVLENKRLRVGVLASKGADVVEFRYKPLDLDVLWHAPQTVLPPGQAVPPSPRARGRSSIITPGLAGSVAELGSRYHLQGGGIGPAWRGSLASMGCSRGRGSGRTDRSRVLCGNRADTIPAGAENDSRKRLARPAPSGIAFQSGRRGHALSLGTSPRHRNTFP
jgi:hypothetical protein